MKILFVCMQYIHSARWINQLKNTEHEIFVFDCLDKPIHKDLQWTNYITNWGKRKLPYIKGEYYLEKNQPKIYDKVVPFLKVTASEKLEEIIKEIQPDLVHSLEMQSETYPLLKISKKLIFNLAAFSWGSDLYLYQDKKVHRKQLQEILTKTNFFFSDNNRDQQLARKIGFTNKGYVFPGGGGYQLLELQKYLQPIKDRKFILIKGYHHWAGRALTVLNALELITDEIKDYSIYVYSAHPIVIEKIEELNRKYTLKIEYSSRYNEITHDELLQKFGKALIAIGNSISDGIPNTLLEAIICGAFPIQSNPGGATEDYITHKKNGLLINNPEDANEVASLIQQAITTPKMIENAFVTNQEIAKKLDFKLIQEQVLEAYKQIEATINE